MVESRKIIQNYFQVVNSTVHRLLFTRFSGTCFCRIWVIFVCQTLLHSHRLSGVLSIRIQPFLFLRFNFFFRTANSNYSRITPRQCSQQPATFESCGHIKLRISSEIQGLICLTFSYNGVKRQTRKPLDFCSKYSIFFCNSNSRSGKTNNLTKISISNQHLQRSRYLLHAIIQIRGLEKNN